MLRASLLTLLALVAFAANSVLCRWALGDNTVDASSFTIIRLLSGAVVLYAIVSASTDRAELAAAGSWLSSAALFIYALAFSFAYISLSTGTGALVLFGAVQLTIIVISLITGHRLYAIEWVGLVLAFCGFIFLSLPGVTAPSPIGFTLMTIAGIAWGVYTLQGRGSNKPLLDTAANFIRTLPMVLALAAIMFSTQLSGPELSSRGILLAVLSGAIASGLGYSIWYAALPSLSASQAAVVQLLVPVIAALGGVVFVGEAITVRLSVATVLILGGILVVILGRKYFADAATK